MDKVFQLDNMMWYSFNPEHESGLSPPCSTEENALNFFALNCEHNEGFCHGETCNQCEKVDQPPTSEPSEPGWYWYKGIKHFSDWNIIEFQNINNELLSIPSHLPIKYFEGQLIGPIKEPT